MIPGGTKSLFISGFAAGLAALAFNFLIRLEGLAPFPPEAALSGFIGIVPASVEEPMVQQFGDLAGQLGLVVATIIAAAVYGILLILFVRFAAPRLRSIRLSVFEVLLCFSLILWLLFGLLLFPVLGESAFGILGASSSPLGVWTYPATLLLVQGIFALLLSPKFKAMPAAPSAAGVLSSFRESRRDFVEKSAIALFASLAAVLGLFGLGSTFAEQIQPSGGMAAIDLKDAPAIFSDPRLAALVDSEVTLNDSFYRVAIDIIDPTVDASAWSLTVNGLVGNPKTYSYEGIQALPPTSLYDTFECVSNQINGNLIGNAKWTGVKLSDLLQDAGGPQPSASYVVFYSVDGYSVGIPLDKALMPDSIAAYLMNDQQLPTRHGYPLRAVVPGLYGMMSAKWINRISLLDSTYRGYWQTRGWSNVGTVNTVTFITAPQGGSQVSLGQNGGSIIIAGYAYAGDRGVSKVEVSFDDGKTWQEAQLKKPLSSTTWALWAYEWQSPSQGEHFVYARATDGSGRVQTSTMADTFPNGATGYAGFVFRVAA